MLQAPRLQQDTRFTGFPAVRKIKSTKPIGKLLGSFGAPLLNDGQVIVEARHTGPGFGISFLIEINAVRGELL
jgi:hypothetical protein